VKACLAQRACIGHLCPFMNATVTTKLTTRSTSIERESENESERVRVRMCEREWCCCSKYSQHTRNKIDADTYQSLLHRAFHPCISNMLCHVVWVVLLGVAGHFGFRCVVLVFVESAAAAAAAADVVAVCMLYYCCCC
jgi:hypothetical protein